MILPAHHFCLKNKVPQKKKEKSYGNTKSHSFYENYENAVRDPLYIKSLPISSEKESISNRVKHIHDISKIPSLL